MNFGNKLFLSLTTLLEVYCYCIGIWTIQFPGCNIPGTLSSYLYYSSCFDIFSCLSIFITMFRSLFCFFFRSYYWLQTLVNINIYISNNIYIYKLKIMHYEFSVLAVMPLLHIWGFIQVQIQMILIYCWIKTIRFMYIMQWTEDRHASCTSEVNIESARASW